MKKVSKIPLLSLRILWIPLGIAFIAFAWDKVLSSQLVRPYTEAGAEYYFYEMKSKIMDTMKKETETKTSEQKVLTFFGTSHMGEFSLEEFAKESPGLIVYNLSAPSAPYSFHNFTLERMLDRNIPLDYAILEYYPDSAIDYSNRYALRYSYDFNYFLKNWDVFPTNEWDVFLRSRVFRTSVFPPRFKEAMHRIKHPDELAYLMAIRNGLMNESDKYKGGIPNSLLSNTPEDKLDSESERIYRETYRSFFLSKTQEAFLRKFLEKARSKGVKVVLWSPLLYSKFAKLVQDSKFFPEWLRLRDKLKEEFPEILVLDMESYRSSVKCQKFIDPHHLSGGCYLEPTRILISFLEENAGLPKTKVR
ncbi:hypothetical protein CH373_06780 [Leptospira perolatii]|uniref:DUF1574 domain-containing protein n=1 Tax=Leptospira perolatii TaxID=2023191 RepID=A0A2M9ZPC6_9LEPT|nr:DUF1574 family protein [Leptospira perolatii]PJZ70640.1 hypothetical protein CH360_03640 [Leptospira perolatii]PJZ73851.1 hypothetical protein CH373_06780 [Leptospira perolatii]